MMSFVVQFLFGYIIHWCCFIVFAVFVLLCFDCSCTCYYCYCCCTKVMVFILILVVGFLLLMFLLHRGSCSYSYCRYSNRCCCCCSFISSHVSIVCSIRTPSCRLAPPSLLLTLTQTGRRKKKRTFNNVASSESVRLFNFFYLVYYVIVFIYGGFYEAQLRVNRRLI